VRTRRSLRTVSLRACSGASRPFASLRPLGRLRRPGPALRAPEGWHLSERPGRQISEQETWPPRRQRTAEEVDEIYASAIDKIRCWIREKRATLPPGSANRALLEELRDLPPEKVFDELLSRSYPNPERVGCPPYQVLMELGTRTRSLDDHWLEHIWHCHPCSTELRTLVRSYAPPDPS
jgi:hypothetical protein